MIKLSRFACLEVGVAAFSLSVSLVGSRMLDKTKKEAEVLNAQLKSAPLAGIGQDYPFLSVVIPARNEEAKIEACLVSILEQDYPNLEVIVVDDNSTDQTSQILKQLAEDPRYHQQLSLVAASQPTLGWLGKPNALWQGFHKINPASQWLLFLDADVRLRPGVLRGAVSVAQTKGLDMLSLAPLPLPTQSFWYQVLIAELFKLYALAISNPLNPPKLDSVEAASAIGAFILTRKAAYQASGGHQAVRDCVIEDIELARSFRKGGYTTLQATAFELLNNEAYQNLGELWEGTTKNLFLVAGRSWSRVVAMLLGEWLYGLLPIGLLTIRLLLNRRFNSFAVNRDRSGENFSRLINIVAIVGIFTLHLKFNRQVKIPPRYALFYPVAVIVSSLLTLTSAIRIGIIRSVRWKGRDIPTH